MDIPLVLESLRPSAKWGPCANSDSTYEQLKTTWADTETTCPTLAEMRAEWLRIQDGAAAAEVAKLRTEANKALDDKQPLAAVIRAVAATLVEEINLLRTAMRLPIRARDQIAASIKAKIEAGVADGPQSITKNV